MFAILVFIFGMALALLSIIKSQEIFNEFGEFGGLIIIALMMFGGVILATAGMIVILASNL